MTDWEFSEFGYPIPKGRPEGDSRMSIDPTRLQATSHASRCRLEDLPYEVLDAVCAHLAPLDAARDDIANFSLASKKCAKGASRRRLERIVITVTTTSEVQQAVDELENALARSERQGCVRQMKLRDRPSHTGKKRSRRVHGSWQPYEDEDSEADDEDDHSLCRLPRAQPPLRASNPSEGFGMFLRFPHYRPTPPEQIEENGRRCQALGSLIGKLCNLSDAVWDCDFTIPVCLLNTLKLANPGASLHVHNFFLREKPFRGMRFAGDDARANENALIMSPNLDTMVWRQEGGSDGVNKEIALWCMLQGASPHLKHVVLEWGGRPVSATDVGVLPFKPTEERTKLQTLSLGPVKARHFWEWGDVVDFEELSTLRLRVPLTDDAVQALVNMFKACPLKRLRVLEIRHADDVVAQQTGITVPHLLTHMLPLEHLEFTGPISADYSILPALQLHGPTLRVLELKPIFRSRSNRRLVNDLRDIMDIQTQCPLLERLDVTVARTHGDYRELTIYAWLARMNRLKHLKLRLDCSMQTPEPKAVQRSFGDGDVKLSFDDYRSGLINTAIDETLTTSIFGLFRPQMKYLRIKPQGHGDFGRRWHDEQAMEVLDWIGRDWVVRRAADGQGEISRGGCIREGPTGGGPWRGEKLLRADFGREPGFDDDAREDLREIWTSVWSGQDGDRTEQWASMELASFRQ